MTQRLDELIGDVQRLQEEVQAEFDRKREGFRFFVEDRRIHFSEQMAAQQRMFKTGLFRSILSAPVMTVVVAPVVYAGIVPMLLLDLFLLVYQATCFPAYRIPKARRSDYLVFDRADLPYLNALERLNCAYCSYGNALFAYAREIAARTEQYFCPIKHARRILAAHDHYLGFFEYGDAESYRMGLERLRDQMDRERRAQRGVV